MCGRYRLSRRKQIIEEHFDSVSWDEDWNPRYNTHPTCTSDPATPERTNPSSFNYALGLGSSLG
jgi:putative SOS response-associated peptidase YedK